MILAQFHLWTTVNFQLRQRHTRSALRALDSQFLADSSIKGKLTKNMAFIQPSRLCSAVHVPWQGIVHYSPSVSLVSSRLHRYHRIYTEAWSPLPSSGRKLARCCMSNRPESWHSTHSRTATWSCCPQQWSSRLLQYHLVCLLPLNVLICFPLYFIPMSADCTFYPLQTHPSWIRGVLLNLSWYLRTEL